MVRAIRTNQPTWTTRRLLAWTTQYFQGKDIDNPRLAAEMLLSHVLGVSRLKLYMDPDRPASELERSAFRELVERCANHEPVDYLVGQTPFFSLMLKVSPQVLIPRPSTETVIEHVLQHARRTPGFRSPLIADIDTGSGAIAIALAKHLPEARVIATDINESTIELARENAQAHDVASQIEFRTGNLLEPLVDDRVTYLISNPPYISDNEWLQVSSNVKDYEPAQALRGGLDGMNYIKPIIEQATKCLQVPGQLVLEIGASQKQSVLELVSRTKDLYHAHILADHEGLPRVLVADTES